MSAKVVLLSTFFTYLMIDNNGTRLSQKLTYLVWPYMVYTFFQFVFSPLGHPIRLTNVRLEKITIQNRPETEKLNYWKPFYGI